MEYTIEEPAVIDIIATALPEVCAGEENGSIELTIEGGTAPVQHPIEQRNQLCSRQDGTIRPSIRQLYHFYTGRQQVRGKCIDCSRSGRQPECRRRTGLWL